jgi:hypothetical protein
MSMKHASPVLALVLVAALGAAPASAIEITLQNDTFAGGAAGFQAGFVTGEVAAARFDPPGPFPMNVTGVQFLFGDIAVQQVVILYIWEDDLGANLPGAEIYSEGFMATGSSAALNSINLSGAGVQVNGPFRVGLEFTHDGLPSIARDTDGTIDTANNFLRANGFGWFPSSLFGLAGDWILRAEVEAASTDTPPTAADRGKLALAPNPFNPATEVQLTLPVPGLVTIEVYDLRGRHVDSLEEGIFLPAGSHSFPYRTALSSGVYLMRATSGSWSQTAKFTVVE